MTSPFPHPTRFRLPLCAPRIKAVLDGSMTQVRIPLPAKAPGRAGWTADPFLGAGWHRVPDGERVFANFIEGDCLVVTEPWAVGQCADDIPSYCLSPEIWLEENGGLWYGTDDRPPSPIAPRGRWRSAIEMPTWASRIQMRVTGVRIGPTECTDEEALREGVIRVPGGWSWHAGGYAHETPREAARALWCALYPMLPWGDGRAVSILSLERHDLPSRRIASQAHSGV